MFKTKRYIAIDLGAESGRVMVGTVSTDGISLAEVHRFPNIQVSIPTLNGKSTLHWDILRLFAEIKTGLAHVADRFDPKEIAGVGVDTWGVDFGLLDSTGALLGNPVGYRDSRTDGMIDAVFAKIPKARIDAITGIQTMFLNSLFQLASLSFSNSPQLAAAKYALFLPDLLTYWLSGKLGTDYTIASTSQMLDATTRAFSDEILSAINIPLKLFPPISIPGTRQALRGTLLASANEKLAATHIPVIAVGGHDTACAVAAVPANSPHWLFLSSGTWSLLGTESDQPILTPEAVAANLTNEGGVGGKIRLLKNLAGLWLLQECKRHWQSEGHTYDYTQLTAMAEQAAGTKTILDLDDPRFSSPGAMPQKIIDHCNATNQHAPQSHAEFVRVILESLAATYAKVAAQLSSATGKKFDALHIVGGGSQNNVLNQLAADACKITVHAGPVEATALGNVLTQALTVGQLDSLSAARALIARSTTPKTFHPR